VAKARQHDVPVLAATEPKLVARNKPVTGKPEVNAKMTPEKTSSVKSQKSQGNPATKPTSPTKASPNTKAAKLTPEQEWFQLLKQEGALSSLQLKRLKELLEKTTSLAISAEGKGNKARTALFFALSTGKAEAVSLIMRANAQTKRDMAGTLRQVLDEVLIVGDSEVSTLKACLSMLSASELTVLRDTLNQQYKPGEMRKQVAGKLWEVLLEKGLTQEANVAIDNQIQPQGSAKTTKTVARAEPVTSQNSAPVPFDSVDEHGYNALMRAAADGNADIVDRIIRGKSGVQQIKAVDKGGWNALMIAAENGHTEVAKYLIDHTSGTQQVKMASMDCWNALKIAAAKGHAEVIKLLIAHTSATEQAKMVDKDGWNALMNAAQFGHTEVVKLLIDHPSGTEQAKMVDKDGNNALMIAAANNRTEVVKLLIAHTSGTEQAKMVNKNSFNALMNAAQLGRAEVIKLLIAHPSGTEQAKMVDNDDFNALMIAIETGRTEIIKLLQ
jgi:ankyrin repeat protein